MWRIRELYSNHVVGLFIANGDAEQTAVYAVKSYHSRNPTGITFDNQSMLDVDVIWLDYSGHEHHYVTLQPGGSTGFETYVTHPWIVRDRQSRRILDWNWGDNEQQNLEINDSDIRPREGSVAVDLKITNLLPFAVDVFWLAYDGTETLYATLDQGKSYEQSTYENTSLAHKAATFW